MHRNIEERKQTFQEKDITETLPNIVYNAYRHTPYHTLL